MGEEIAGIVEETRIKLGMRTYKEKNEEMEVEKKEEDFKKWRK